MSFAPAQSAILGDGRLHLHHGPIDLIIDAWGDGRETAFRSAASSFEHVLQELAAELPQLRSPASTARQFDGTIARRMHRAVQPYAQEFITPMAAVAGAVADHILDQMLRSGGISKAYVNNGGDIALHLETPQTFSCASPQGTISLNAHHKVKGIATSGWRGRSHSLGIADNVTVLAPTAASADAAATMIANHTNLDAHPAISRKPACELAPDSDLGEMMVTTGVGELALSDIRCALQQGTSFAWTLVDKSLIIAAMVSLKGHSRMVASKQAPALILGQ